MQPALLINPSTSIIVWFVKHSQVAFTIDKCTCIATFSARYFPNGRLSHSPVRTYGLNFRTDEVSWHQDRQIEFTVCHVLTYVVNPPNRNILHKSVALANFFFLKNKNNNKMKKKNKSTIKSFRSIAALACCHNLFPKLVTYLSLLQHFFSF